MRVQVHPADAAEQGACSYYRLVWPATHLASLGHDITFDGSLPGEFDRRTHALVGVAAIDVDVVVLQRPLKRILADLIPHLQANGVAVVVEVDDDFTCMPPSNPTWRFAHPKRDPDRNWQHLTRACGLADLVTVSTPALARRYGAHGRVSVLPNFVPERYLEVSVPRPDGPPVLGWTGTPTTHGGDLEVIGGRVPSVLAQTGARFHAIGSAATLEVLGIDGDGFDTQVTDWAPLLDGYPEVVAGLDVGMVPLRACAFAEAKSALKGAEYAALGVPFAASPTSEYHRMHKLGVGLLCKTPRHWEGTLRRLLTLPDLRADVAGRGREVMRGHTVEGNSWRWWEAWNDAVVNHRVRRLVA